MVAVLLAILFITIFSYQNSVSPQDSIPGINTRIHVLDNHVRNVDSYASNTLRISTYRTLESLNNYTAQNGFFTQATFEQTFKECLTCGFTNCATRLEQCPEPLPGYDLYSRLDEISALTEENLNIITTYNISNVNITQEYPFEIIVSLDLNYSVKDSASDRYASWNRSIHLQEVVPIDAISDPLQSGYDHTLDKKIYQTNICSFNQSCWNITTVQQFYNEQTFRYHENATSFLSRYWNSTTRSSCCGIESFVNKSIATKTNTSYIDIYYWQNTYACPKGTNILAYDGTQIAPNYYIDEISAGRYNIATAGVFVCN